MTELHPFELSKISKVKFSEGSKAKSPSNVDYFPLLLFLIIITINNHNTGIFVFCKKLEHKWTKTKTGI